MCEIFPIIIIYPQYAKISPQYAKISAQYTKISPQHAKINSTISSPLSSPLLKFNDGPILFLLLQRRLLLETLWTTAHWSRLEIARCFGFLLVSDLAFLSGKILSCSCLFSIFMKYPKNKDWLIWLFEFRWWWWKSQILFQVETVNQPWSLLTVWKRSWHPTKKYSVGIMLLMRTWASRYRKYRQPTWYFLFRYFLWNRKYRVGSVGGGSTLVTNDQPSYFQPTREMAHSIAWEIERWHNSKGDQPICF